MCVPGEYVLDNFKLILYTLFVLEEFQLKTTFQATNT